MTILLFQDDAYLKHCSATVVAVEDGKIQTDRTVFYARGGGQPGDRGVLDWQGKSLRIVDTIKTAEGDHWHVLDTDSGESLDITPGDTVELSLDWDRRYRFMRFHSCLHMLCSLIDAPVSDTAGRLM